MSIPTDSPAYLTVNRRDVILRERLTSLDAYRGLIMIALACASFGLAETAKRHLAEQPDSRVWSLVKYEFSHVEWVGCSFTDLIQPSFMFMVGVAAAYSYAKRRQNGDSYVRMLGHALWRSVVLVLLGVFLMSNGSPATEWSLVIVLSQIGLGYPFVFLLWGWRPIVQLIAIGAILAGTWLLFVKYPGAGIDVTTGAPEVGVSAEWAEQHLSGIAPAWHKNANIGHAVDVRLLNWFPREKPFEFNEGGYQTLNFLPSIATMLAGLMCGELLRSQRSSRWKLTALLIAAAAGLAIGQALNLTEVCPIVKRIWTPSWALFSGGWCILLLAAFYWVIDVCGFRRWSFPLVVMGMNSMAAYCMGMLLRPWTAQTLKTHFGPEVFLWGGAAFEPTVRHCLTGLVFWLMCLWMYRQRIFVRI